MKNITRVLALLLALILVLGLVVTGFAEGTSGSSPDTKGKITIDNAVNGQTYKIYRILELESFDETAKAYSYKVAQKWNTFITTEATDFFEIHNNRADNIEDGYVSWKGENTEARAAEFAKRALAYAKKEVNGKPQIEPDDKKTAESETVVFDGTNGAGLPLGYYLLDSSLGTLCSLDTTNSEVNIQEKNKAPTNTKQVQEDSKIGQTDEYSGVNDADIGQTVNFKSTIKAQAGAQKYVFHDTMSAGLTFDGTVTVTKGTETVAGNNYTLKTKGNADTNMNPTDECTFEIVFNQDFCDTLKDETIVISYSATLNDQAVIGTKTGVEGNTNKSYLSYGENSKTTESKTTTNTWEVKVFKYHTDAASQTQALAGAKFTLNKNDTERTAIKLIRVGEATSTTYRVAKADESTTAITEIITDASGKFTIQGLDSDTYYLTEKEAPKGYNKLKDPIKIVIDENGNVKVNDATTAVTEVGVENKTGAEMPSTGGIGTTVFYVVGGILAVGAAVLLVTKKRMERG